MYICALQTIQLHKKAMKTINDFNFNNKKAIIRVDFNVPLNDQFQVTDDNRIVAAKPTIDKIEKEQAGKVKVVRIDADQNKNLMKVLNVRGIPQLILYKNAEQAWNKTGVATEAEILVQVKKAKK